MSGMKTNILFIPILSANAPKYGDEMNIAVLITARNSPEILFFQFLSSISPGVAGCARL